MPVVQLTVRLKPELAAYLKCRARDEDRTVNSVLARLVKKEALTAPSQPKPQKECA